jgi:DNA invertase Pin-like site-specific DNA recombinase
MSTAVIYCRVSCEDQIERNALNLPTQERKCRKHCEQQSWTVLRVFTDAGESARTADRPQLQEMLAFCRLNKGKVTHVVVADLRAGWLATSSTKVASLRFSQSTRSS